jgi:uncharacterized protein YpuA (DUF1002 family)
MAVSDKYTLLVYYVHSYLESVSNELVVTKDSTVENFRDNKVNEAHCSKICKHSLTQYNYELSNNQVCNGINLFLKSWAIKQIK